MSTNLPKIQYIGKSNGFFVESLAITWLLVGGKDTFRRSSLFQLWTATFFYISICCPNLPICPMYVPVLRLQVHSKISIYPVLHFCGSVRIKHGSDTWYLRQSAFLKPQHKPSKDRSVLIYLYFILFYFLIVCPYSSPLWQIIKGSTFEPLLSIVDHDLLDLSFVYPCFNFSILLLSNPPVK